MNTTNITFEDDSTKSEVIYTAKKHWVVWILPTLLTAIGTLGILPTIFGVGFIRLFGIALLLVLYKGVKSFLQIRNTTIYLTESQLSISKGILSKTTLDIPLNKMEGIILKQNPIERLFNIGKIIISTGGIYQTYFVTDPEYLSKLLDKNISK